MFKDDTNAKALLVTLAYYDRLDGAWPDQHRLEEDCSMSRASIGRATKSLEELNILYVHRWKWKGRRRPNIYVIDPTERMSFVTMLQGDTWTGKVAMLQSDTWRPKPKRTMLQGDTRTMLQADTRTMLQADTLIKRKVKQEEDSGKEELHTPLSMIEGRQDDCIAPRNAIPEDAKEAQRREWQARTRHREGQDGS